MSALELLRSLSSQPLMAALNSRISRLKRLARPIAPGLTRALVASTFVEDGFRTLFELPSQIAFFSTALGIPSVLSRFVIIIAVLTSLASTTMFLLPRTTARGAKALLGCVLYQQLVYGRHSALTAGNFGFLVRNACMAGTLALFLTKNTPEPALPGAGTGARLRKGARDNAALLVRILFALACFEMFDVVGWGWALVIVPAACALVVGFQAEICAILLIFFYTLGAAVANPFWSVSVTSKEMLHMRDLMRYEFLQTVSILGGLLLVIMSGPGAFSVDSKLRQGKAW